VEKYGTARQATDGNTIRRMRVSCWITEATDTLRICTTYDFSTTKMVMRTCLGIALIRTLRVFKTYGVGVTSWNQIVRGPRADPACTPVHVVTAQGKPFNVKNHRES
jgi:hypothetical protein